MAFLLPIFLPKVTSQKCRFLRICNNVSVTEAGQLIITLNDQDLAYTVVGRATGTSEIVGMAIISTKSKAPTIMVRAF